MTKKQKIEKKALLDRTLLVIIVIYKFFFFCLRPHKFSHGTDFKPINSNFVFHIFGLIRLDTSLEYFLIGLVFIRYSSRVNKGSRV